MWNLQNDGRILDLQRARGDVCLPRTTNPNEHPWKRRDWLAGSVVFKCFMCCVCQGWKKKMQSHTWTTAKKKHAPRQRCDLQPDASTAAPHGISYRDWGMRRSDNKLPFLCDTQEQGGTKEDESWKQKHNSCLRRLVHTGCEDTAQILAFPPPNNLQNA